MLVILGNSAHLNPFLLQKGFFSRTESRRHLISRAQISVNAHSLIKDGTVSFSVTVAFWG